MHATYYPKRCMRNPGVHGADRMREGRGRTMGQAIGRSPETDGQGRLRRSSSGEQLSDRVEASRESPQIDDVDSFQRARQRPRDMPARLVSFSATHRPFLLSTMSALGICSLPMDTIFCIIQNLTSCNAESGVTQRRHLLSLALTCRFLSEPTLDTMQSILGMHYLMGAMTVSMPPLNS